ncbi:Integrin alpha-PS3 [Chionoecetes opilio]|uniref:Integrin alpha-PS3 n=1 Tax=Chionoecetes opilio TaxID=41210 RepID=A0A8J4Y371_CHIOP|nr:Integrin alpha-PS3 [Chionoecetes opilio]
MVGAPRANSSYYHANQITEPGAMFKCDLRGATCMEFIVDGSGNTESHNIQSEYSYQDLKNYGWLGASLDSQPRLRDDRQVTGVCAPSWKNQLYYSPQQQHNQQYMNGVCYLFDDSDTYKTVKKLLPLVSYGKQTKLVNNKRFYHYGLGQAGMSIHFPENQTSFIVGSPGVFNWHGET